MVHRLMVRHCAPILILLLLASACDGNSNPLGSFQTGRGDLLESVPSDRDLFGDQEQTGNATSRSVSVIYQKYFADAITQNSGSRWSKTNELGSSAWALSADAYSTPRAWRIEGFSGSPDGEVDSLVTRDFVIPAGADNVKLTFQTRYRLNGATWCEIVADGDAAPTTLVLSNGQNASYPNWDRVTVKLASYDGWSSGHTIRLLFYFHGTPLPGDSLAIDNVAVYRTLLGTPENVSASDGTSANSIDVSWTHSAVLPHPGQYRITRTHADGTGAELVGSVAYPGTTFTDMTARVDAQQQGVLYESPQFKYTVEAYRTGYTSANASDTGSTSTGAWPKVHLGEGTAGHLLTYNGKPAAWIWRENYFPTQPGLFFRAADDVNGNGNWSYEAQFETADYSGSVGYGMFPTPALAYYTDSGTRLRRIEFDGMAYAGSTASDKDFTAEKVAGMVQLGNGTVIMLYNDAGRVMVNRSTTASHFLGWTAPVKLATGTVISDSVYLLGDRVIFYFFDSIGRLNLGALTANATTFNAPTLISNAGGDVRGLVVEGRPAVVYLNGSGLYYRRSLNATGTSWAAATLITAQAERFDAADVNGVPAVCWKHTRSEMDPETQYTDYFSELFYQEAHDSDGAAWYPPQFLEQEWYGDMEYYLVGGSFWHIDLSDVNGQPAVMYTLNSNQYSADDVDNMWYTVRVP